jgi:hypothetical protein
VRGERQTMTTITLKIPNSKRCYGTCHGTACLGKTVCLEKESKVPREDSMSRKDCVPREVQQDS